MIRFPAGYDSLNRIKRYQDYYQASYGVMLLSAGQFSPLSLFAAGEQGAWYDPSDFLPNWRLNLLTRTEEFDNTAWTKAAGVTTVTANAVAAPNGTQTADLLTSGAGDGYVYQTVTLVAGVTYTFSVWLKAQSPSSFSTFLQIYNASDAGTTQTITVTSDWQMFSLTKTVSQSGGYLMLIGGSSTLSNENLYAWGADLRLTSNASVSPTYQKITDGIQDYFTYQPQPVMFTDSAGTTPVTAVEQPVGLLLDKSKGLALGAELVTNGGLDGTSGWSGTTGAISGGKLVWSSVVTNSGIYQSNASYTGGAYQVTVVIDSISSGGVSASLGVNTAVTSANATVLTTPGTHTFVTSNFGADTLLRLYSVGTSTTATIDSVSVKRISGNHASQSTAASRPVLSARVNLLTYSEQFDNAAWIKTNATISSNATTAPDGTATADALIEATDTNLFHSTNISVATLLSAQHTFSIAVKANGRNWVVLNFAISNGALSTFDARAWFNVSNGTVGTVLGSGATASIASLGNGWYRCTLNSEAYTGANRKVLIATATGDGSTAHNGDGTSGIYLWGADLRVTNVGVNLPAYQRVAAATDYDTSGFPLYLRFDGTDDSLATGTIDFTATDKMSVFAGVRKLSDAAGGNLVELGTSSSAGGFGITAPDGVAANYGARSTGSISRGQTATTYTAPLTNVLTAYGDISGDMLGLRVNGSLVATNVLDQGTGNYANAALSIGRRGAASAILNGNLYSLIVRGALSTDAQIASTETWVNGKTGAY